MTKKLLGKICIALAALLLIYIVICDFAMTMSLTVTIYFIVFICLLIAYAYTLLKPIDKEVRGPSFRYIFIKIATYMFVIATFALMLFNILYPKRRLSDDKKYDYIIVFGAGITDGKTEIINSRLNKALEYADKYKRCRFILTGAKGENEPIEEAYYMKSYMTYRGVEDDRIIVDPFSINTEENIKNSLELIKNDARKRNTRERIFTRPFMNRKDRFDMDFLNIGFMSSEFHITRINLMARKQGVLKPYDIPCDTRILYLFYQYMRENLSMFKALVLNQLKI